MRSWYSSLSVKLQTNPERVSGETKSSVVSISIMILAKLGHRLALVSTDKLNISAFPVFTTR